MNRHDLDAFLDCFDPEYRSETPVHPTRSFTGREQVRRNWSAVFESTPDFRADLLRTSIDGEVVWIEWRMYGTRTDGTELDQRGVIVMGIPEDRIQWVASTRTGMDGRGRDLGGAPSHRERRRVTRSSVDA